MDTPVPKHNPLCRSMPPLLFLLISGLCVGGCATLRSAIQKNASGSLGAPDGRPVTAAELDELTRAFADRYVGLLSSTCDALKQDNPDPAQRREAQDLLLNCATNVYDIASNPDAFTRMLDLVVVTTLESQVWIDDDRTGDVFGERGEVLVRALHHGRVEAWALAGQVLRPDQLDLLDYTIWDWRRHNPDMVRAPFVRFSNFAVGRGKSAAAEALAAGGFFQPVGQASKAVDEARLLTERMFYIAKRAPTLLRWQAVALQDETLATPEISRALGEVHRLTDAAERLPKEVAAERQAIAATVDEHMKAADRTVAAVRASIAEANGVATTLNDTGRSLDAMLKSADGLLARYDSRQRWATTAESRPFDVREYTQGVKELAGALGQMNDVMKSSDQLLGSSDWALRIQQVNESADGRMKVVAERGEALVDVIFRRIYFALAAFFGLLVLYRLFTRLLAPRPATSAVNTSAPRERDVNDPSAVEGGLDEGVFQ